MPECTHLPEQLTPLFHAQDYITGTEFEITLCRSCGFTVTTPRPTSEELPRFYSPGYYGVPTANRFPLIVEKPQRFLNGLRAKQVENCNGRRSGRVLDVGCGRGFLLKVFQKRGWEVTGTELTDQAANFARSVLNLPVCTGSFQEMKLPANHFDAVVMWHVLEHVSDPQTTLAEVNRVLKPGGVFLIGVPNFGAWEARFSRAKWFHLDVPRHLTHFTNETLQCALLAAGFQVKTRYGNAPEYDVFSFVQSCQNWLGLRHNLLYELMRRRDAKVFSGQAAPFWQVVASILLAVPLGILSLPFTILAGLLHRGGTITIFAIKNQPGGENSGR